MSNKTGSKDTAANITLSPNKVYWASRRGMLELDLVLMPFAKNIYPTLGREDQQRYHRLLEQEDQDLFTWFLGRGRPEDTDLRMIVGVVLANTGLGDV
jgi:antitoxin CptB